MVVWLSERTRLDPQGLGAVKTQPEPASDPVCTEGSGLRIRTIYKGLSLSLQSVIQEKVSGVVLLKLGAERKTRVTMQDSFHPYIKIKI